MPRFCLLPAGTAWFCCILCTPRLHGDLRMPCMSLLSVRNGLVLLLLLSASASQGLRMPCMALLSGRNGLVLLRLVYITTSRGFTYAVHGFAFRPERLGSV